MLRSENTRNIVTRQWLNPLKLLHQIDAYHWPNKNDYITFQAFKG